MDCFMLGEIKHYTLISREFSICNLESLRSYLLEYSIAEPQMLYFQAPAGDGFTIGIGGPMAFVEYTQASKNPPYLAVRGDSDNWNEYIEFDAGGTPTPVALAICIPIEKAIEVITYFFLHKRIPESEEWTDKKRPNST